MIEDSLNLRQPENGGHIIQETVAILDNERLGSANMSETEGRPHPYEQDLPVSIDKN